MSQSRASNSALWRREIFTKLTKSPTATSTPTAILQIRSHGVTDGTSNFPGAPPDPEISQTRPLRRSQMHKQNPIFGNGVLEGILNIRPLPQVSELPRAPSHSSTSRGMRASSPGPLSSSPGPLSSSFGPTSSRPEQASDLRSADPCHDDTDTDI